MTATPPPDRAWAGHVAFPRSDSDLRSTSICPACLTPLSSVVCGRCGLDLAHPAAVELASASVAIADAMDARLDIIGRIRRDTAAATAAPAEAASAPSPAIPTDLPTAGPTALPAEPRAAEARAAEADGPRRSGIQIALIIVGISLLSVFAAFGLVYAFVTFGQAVRLSIIAAGTIATMIAAAVLARRGLRSTGEGVAVLASVMLLLDAWALQLNDPSGLGAAPERQYWGFALLIIGGAIAVWSQLGRLVAPALVASVILPVGAGLITSHLASATLRSIEGADLTAGALAVVIVAAGSALVVPREPAVLRAVARIAGHALAAGGAIVALGSLAFLHPDNRWAPAIAGIVLALAVGVHLIVLHRVPAPSRRALERIVAIAIGAGAAISAVAGATLSALRIDQDRVIASAPLLASVLVAVLAEQIWRRSSAGTVLRAAAASATITAGVHVVVAAAIAGIIGSSAFVEAATRGFAIVRLTAGALVADPEPATVAALGALALSLGLIAGSWASLRLLVSRARALTIIVGIVVVAAVPLLGAWWLVMLAFGVLAVGGALVLHRAHRESSADRRRAVLALGASLAVGASFGAFAVAWAVTRSWWIGLVITLLTIAISRTSTPLHLARAGGLAIAAVLTIGSSAALASDITAAIPGAPVSAAATMLAASAVIIVAAQLGRLARLERLVVQPIALLGAVVAALLDPAPLPGTITGLALLAVALVIVLARHDRRSPSERTAAAVAAAVIPLVIARCSALVADLLQLDAPVAASVIVSALIVSAALSLVLLRSSTTLRLAADVSSLLIAELVLLAVVLPDVGAHSVAVLLVGVVALLVAIDHDGLFASRSARRWLGWLAAAHGVIALWMTLVESGVDDPEAFTLPVAGLLLAIIAALVLARRRAGGEPGAAIAPLTFVALVLALVPSALVGATAATTVDARTVLVALAAVTLALAPLPRVASIDPAMPGLVTALVAAGVTALAVLVAVQSWQLAIDGVALTGSALLRAALVVTVPAGVAVTARLMAPEGSTGSAVHRVAVAAPIGFAALAAATLGISGAADPVELVSVPLAIGLLALGTLQLDRDSSARSWPWLGPGVTALLVPSLLAVDAAAEPLWRTAALAVVGTAVFVIALARKLQAPFVISGIVLLVHLLVQSWPLLSLVGRAVEWWIWLGLAGVLVMVVAARFERRLQNVRDVASRIRDLR